MGSRYKIKYKEGLYLVTFTVVAWVDLFVRNAYRDCVLESFEYCESSKGLNLHSYVIMTSHVHAIVSSDDDSDLVATIRDLKKFTSIKLVDLIKTVPESRRECLPV